jgi:hypothetical protein
VLLLGLALIGCAARAGAKAEVADVATENTAATRSQAPNVSCEQEFASKRKPIIHTTSKPGPQSHEVYVYCGDASAIQHSTSSLANRKDLLPEPDNSTVNTSANVEQQSNTHKWKIGAGDYYTEIESSDTFTFFVNIAIILVGVMGIVAYRAKNAGTGKDKGALTVLTWIGGLAAILGFGLIVYMTHIYIKKQSTFAEYRAKFAEYRAELDKAITTANLEEKMASLVDAQMRAELQQCTAALQQEEIRIRGLEATTESWPFTRGTPYLLFGVAVGLIIGMLICIPLDVLLSVPRRRYRSATRDKLLDELQNELVRKENETMREILQRLREETKSDKSNESKVEKSDEVATTTDESKVEKSDEVATTTDESKSGKLN